MTNQVVVSSWSSRYPIPYLVMTTYTNLSVYLRPQSCNHANINIAMLWLTSDCWMLYRNENQKHDIHRPQIEMINVPNIVVDLGGLAADQLDTTYSVRCCSNSSPTYLQWLLFFYGKRRLTMGDKIILGKYKTKCDVYSKLKILFVYICLSFWCSLIFVAEYELFFLYVDFRAKLFTDHNIKVFLLIYCHQVLSCTIWYSNILC